MQHLNWCNNDVVETEGKYILNKNIGEVAMERETVDVLKEGH